MKSLGWVVCLVLIGILSFSSVYANTNPTYVEQFLVNSIALNSFKHNESAVLNFKSVLEGLANKSALSAMQVDKETVAIINKIQSEASSSFPIKTNFLDLSDVAVLNNSARIPAKSQQLERAEHLSIKELAEKPGRSPAWIKYAETLARNGKEVLAIGAYINAIRFSDDHAKTIAALNLKLANERDYNVISAIASALDKSPQIAEWHDCSLPIKVGDSMEQVQQAFHVKPVTVASNYTKGTQFMDLSNIGISIIFFIDGKVEQITLKEPFCGKINAIGIGDDLANLEVKMGLPKHPPSHFGNRQYVYGAEEDIIFSYSVNNDNLVTQIRILFNRTLFNQKSHR